MQRIAQIFRVTRRGGFTPPSSPTCAKIFAYFGGAVAQLGARLDGIEEVVGSNPIGSTKYTPVYFLYILQSETSDRYYIGQTQDVSERLVRSQNLFKLLN